uniref:Putative toxin-antitoxin system toxin component, PIN family n=1 Tax=Geobacter metallireducens TaxID=28232 RepID=A0A831UFN7_GEOME
MGKKIDPPLVVIDTNVLVSCLLFGGRLAPLCDLWTKRRIVPLLSRETFDEFRRVLTYPKFSLTAEEIRSLIDLEILPYFDVVEVTETVADACRDPHDDKFLAVAVAGRAAWLITGDKDLLELHTCRETRIVAPGDFLREIAAGS